MKHLLLAILIALLIVSCDTPYKTVTTYTKDSTGRTIKVINKYYDNTYYTQPPVEIMTSPLFYSPYYDYRWNLQYNRPKIVIPYTHQLSTPYRRH
jgi:hypothetical protein